MKFLHNNIDCDFDFVEGICNIMVIENPVIYRKMIFELKKQMDGFDGGFLLTENNKVLSLRKEVDYVESLFDLQLNSRSVLNKIYKKLEEEAMNCNYEDVLDLHSYIQAFVFKIAENYDLEYNLNSRVNIQDILKSVNFSIDYVEEELLDSITKYLDVMHSITGKSIFIFNNLKMFLTDQEIAHLYNFTFQRKYYIMSIERFQIKNNHTNEKVFILDSDLCEIY